MPNLTPPSLQSLASKLPAELLHKLQATLRAQDSYGQSIASSLNSALVVGDSLQVYKPYTPDSPLQVPGTWTAPTLTAGWTNLGAPDETAAYRKGADGIVSVRGTVVSAAVGIAFTLPAGYRPSATFDVPTWVNTGGTQQAARLTVKADGTVSIAVNAPSTWGSIRCRFECSDLSPGVPSCFPFDLSWSFPYPPTLVVAQCADVTNSASPSNLALSLADWQLLARAGGTLLRIRNIPGLLPSTNYSVTVVAF